MAQTKAETKPKPKATVEKHKKTIRDKKLKARNITNHTVQLHLPGGRYVRIGPSEVYEFPESDCRSRALKKLERENAVSIAWPVKKSTSKGKDSTKKDATPSGGKDEDKENST
ncbi:MAG: hypothetical protein LWX54_00570 [Deltaproteobacteria bacterium]|jgi:hypothetical protein|nr:hypothetical protein [Deltaproteobacteria bacterium]